jgi:excinuclease ABC subunit C
MLESILDEIPQMGQARRAALLEQFGSVAALRKATLAEIAMTPGIGEKIAEIIFEYLQKSAHGDGAEIVNTQTGEITNAAK